MMSLTQYIDYQWVANVTSEEYDELIYEYIEDA
jgi:hypothetical protein